MYTVCIYVIYKHIIYAFKKSHHKAPSHYTDRSLRTVWMNTCVKLACWILFLGNLLESSVWVCVCVCLSLFSILSNYDLISSHMHLLLHPAFISLFRDSPLFFSESFILACTVSFCLLPALTPHIQSDGCLLHIVLKACVRAVAGGQWHSV